MVENITVVNYKKKKSRHPTMQQTVLSFMLHLWNLTAVMEFKVKRYSGTINMKTVNISRT